MKDIKDAVLLETVDEILKQISLRLDLKEKMLERHNTSPYTGIVTDEIYKLNKRLWNLTHPKP
jgi:hypothetical protein